MGNKGTKKIAEKTKIHFALMDGPTWQGTVACLRLEPIAAIGSQSSSADLNARVLFLLLFAFRHCLKLPKSSTALAHVISSTLNPFLLTRLGG